MEQAASCKCSRADAPGGRVEDRLGMLDRVIARHAGRPDTLIAVLQKAQELYGHLPRQVQDRVAAGLGIPASEVYGVATFYSLFALDKKGEHRIGVCMGTACYVKGAARILAALGKELGVGAGQTTKDGRFTLEVRHCLGACGLAPVMVIDDRIYAGVEPQDVRRVLSECGSREERLAGSPEPVR